MTTYSLPLDRNDLSPEALRESLRARYPQTVAHFAALPSGDAELRRLYELDTTWRTLSASRRPVADVVVAEPRALPAGAATFDIIYAGGGLNLLDAAVMTLRHGQRVLVMDRFTVGAVHREWNISRHELQELLDVGLLTPAELESMIQREYTDGLVRFAPDHIRVRPAELHLRGVLDVAVDANTLTALCRHKILAANPANRILHQTTFRRCYVDRANGVTVEVTDATGETAYYGAKLLVDGMGATSPVACQLNCGRPFSLVCPTVGTVARGYRQGSDALAVDPNVGEILVTTTDARDGRQLIWEGFPGRDDQVAIYLFHYVNLETPEESAQVDLLGLFEEFFTLLPAYKDSANAAIIKPVYGLIPAGYKNPSRQREARKVLACDRVISLGDAAALQSPLTFCGFGSTVRNLRRITTLLALALRDDCLNAADLSHIRAYEAVPALARAFSKFMIARRDARPEQVNETLNVFCGILDDLGERAAVDFFRDRIGWADYTRLILRTARIYPQIVPLTFRTLTLSDASAWIGAYLAFSRAALQATIYRQALRPALRSIPAYLAVGLLRQVTPRAAFRLTAFIQAQEQMLRGK
jgi:lycopene cyclase CruA